MSKSFLSAEGSSYQFTLSFCSSKNKSAIISKSLNGNAFKLRTCQYARKSIANPEFHSKIRIIVFFIIIFVCHLNLMGHQNSSGRVSDWFTRWHYSASVALILFVPRSLTPLYFSQLANNTMNTFYLILACHRMCEAGQKLPKELVINCHQSATSIISAK